MSYAIKPLPSIDWQKRAEAAEEKVKDARAAIKRGKDLFDSRLSGNREERRLKEILMDLFDAIDSHLE